MASFWRTGRLILHAPEFETLLDAGRRIAEFDDLRSMSVTRDDRQLVLLDVEHGRQEFERSPIRLAIDRLLDNRHIESTLISPGATDAGAARPRFQPYFEADRFKHDSEDTSPCRLNNDQTPIITVMSS